MIKNTRWMPDTCRCCIDYSWDTDADQATRVHTLASVVKKCPDHSLLNDGQIFAILSGENNRKNKVRSAALNLLSSDLSDTFTDEQGNVYIDFKKGISFDWSWSGSGEARVLNIRFIGVSLSNPKKNNIQQWCNTTFGAGKVVII